MVQVAPDNPIAEQIAFKESMLNATQAYMLCPILPLLLRLMAASSVNDPLTLLYGLR